MGKKHFTVVVHSIKHKIPKTTYEVDAFSADRAIETVGKKVKAKFNTPIGDTNYTVDQISDEGESTRIRSRMRLNLQEEYLKLVNHF